MSEQGDVYIAKAQAKLRALEAEVVKTKQFINSIREFEGLAPLYTDLSLTPEPSLGSLRSDQFYGRPLATVVREVLEMRRSADRGPASVNEIYATLIDGGYKFDAASEENAKRGLRISLTKNPAFHRLPNGDYGLSEWYPGAKSTRKERAVEEDDQLPSTASVDCRHAEDGNDSVEGDVEKQEDE